MNEFYDFILNECESFQMKIFDYLSIRISRDQFGAFREISFCIKKTRPLHSLMFSQCFWLYTVSLNFLCILFFQQLKRTIISHTQVGKGHEIYGNDCLKKFLGSCSIKLRNNHMLAKLDWQNYYFYVKYYFRKKNSL